MYAVDGNGPVLLEACLALVVSERDAVPVCDQDGSECLQTDVVYVEILEPLHLPSDVMTHSGVDIQTFEPQVSTWSTAVVRDTSTTAAVENNSSR